MAVTKRTKCNVKHSKAVLALTAAALSLPGMESQAAIPVAEVEANFQYGHYQESDDRMKVQIYHADMILPLSDRLEFSFSIDQDTYSGATPLFNLPQAMQDQPKRKLGVPGFSQLADVIATASPVVGRFEMTSGMRAFKLYEVGAINFFNDYFATHGSAPSTEQINTAGYSALINNNVPTGDRVTQTYSPHPQETRNMPIFGLNYYFDDITLAVSSGISDEPDFRSTFGTANVNWELNDKLTTLNFGTGITFNDISRSVSHGDGSHAFHGGEPEYPELDAESEFYNGSFGVSQVLSKNTLIQFNTSYTHQKGYLSNPYKLVYVRGEITADEYWELEDESSTFQDVSSLEVMGVDLFREVRPDERNQLTFSTQLRQYIPIADASVHFDYRYYNDDWGIDSHTFESTWYQSVPGGITIAPKIRYYSQSQADFYAPYFLAPRADGHYSSDYRLSGYGALSGGVTISKEFSKGFSLEAGVEYYTHQGKLKLGGGGSSDFADYSSYLAHGALKLNLSNIGRVFTGHEGHHQSHHGAHPPAGVMFGHMLEKAGDMMIGYNYMYSDQDGDMYNRSHKVSDQEVVNNACGLEKYVSRAPESLSPGAVGCTSKPDAMVMHMHMFNIMYAPTDWLNLMLMPKIINMEMDMEALDGAAGGEGGHEGKHTSDGLGDTLMVALVKLYKSSQHNIHAGIGLSAPTASIDATLDGTGLSDAELQGYSMQLGSGTWDFVPSLTYMGHTGDWSWGAQVSAIKRMQERNEMGYALGDEIKGSFWGGYQLFSWLNLSMRHIYQAQSQIEGRYNRVNEIDKTLTNISADDLQATPLENPDNYGGQFYDIGFGLSASSPNGKFSGHSLSVEWLQPILHDYNGYQFEREGMLSVRWGYGF